jgi:hypothetical protein
MQDSLSHTETQNQEKNYNFLSDWDKIEKLYDQEWMRICYESVKKEGFINEI